MPLLLYLACHRPHPVWPSPPQVIQVHYQNTAQLSELSAQKAPWSVNPREHTAVFLLSPDEIIALQNKGFVLTPDPTLQNQFLAAQQALTGDSPQERATAPERKQVMPTRAGDVPEEMEMDDDIPVSPQGIPGFPCYATVSETEARIQALANTYPNLISLTDIGDSWEREHGQAGHDLYLLHIHNKNITDKKPVVFIMSGLHAREYAPVELNLRFAETLAANYGKDPQITYLLDSRDFAILPLANPDGRVLAEKQLLWRKNTNDVLCNATETRGVDLNRNFPYHWGCCGGSSDDVCSEVFRGTTAASEPETQAIQRTLSQLFEDRRPHDDQSPAPEDTSGIFLDLHSYSELILWSWGAGPPPPNAEGLSTLGKRLSFFNDYFPEQLADLYANDGTATDYVYGEFGVPAYTIEMGQSFFESCDTFESSVLPKNIAALSYAAAVADAPYLRAQGPIIHDLVWEATTQQVTFTASDSDFGTANGSPPASQVTGATYRLDNGPPQPLSPDTTGHFQNALPKLPAGHHQLSVQAHDQEGFSGPIQNIFIEIAG